MAVAVHIKKSMDPRRQVAANTLAQPWTDKSKQQYNKVAKENKETFRREKQVQELGRHGFNEAAISGMTGMSESSVKSMLKNTGKTINLDGRL